MADYKQIVDFIRDLYGTSDFVPLAVPKFIGNEKKYLNECIDTTFVSSVGKFVDRFEEEMAHYTGAKRAVVCVSGTNALHMALMLVGVERDDEVLTQALTFIATCNALSYIGAHPVFLDVEPSGGRADGIDKTTRTKVIKAYCVADGSLKEFTLTLGDMTQEERQIILDGCLINYNRV